MSEEQSFESEIRCIDEATFRRKIFHKFIYIECLMLKIYPIREIIDGDRCSHDTAGTS